MELTSFAAHAAAFLLSVFLKTVLIFAVAGLVCLGLRRASAASRHLLWAVTLVSLLCLPVFCVLLPPLAAPVLPAPVLPAPLQHRAGVADHVPQVQASITSPSQLANTSSTEANFVPAPAASRLPADDNAAVKSISPRVLAQQFNSSSATTALTVPVRTVASLPQSKPALSAAAPKLTGAEWLVAAWLLGLTLVLSRTMLGLLGAVRLVSRSVAVASGPLTEAAEEARHKMGLRTLPSVRDGSLVAVPMTFGIMRPIVLLPAGAKAWPIERLQAVMLHEIGHIKRRDWLTAMLAEAVCALYWFHPLVWLAARQLRAESEQACDDLVLTSGIPPSEYADHLLEVVRGLTKRRGSLPAVVTMACKQDITARIKTILATSRDRRATTGRGLAAGILAALVIVLPLAAVRPMAAAGAADKAETKTAQPQTDAIPSPLVITFPGDTRSPKQISDWQRINQWRRTLLASHTSPWKATLPDGTCVYLTSLWALNGANAEKTWTPGGTLLSNYGGGSLPFYKHFRSTFYNVDTVLVFPSDSVRRQTRVAFGSTTAHPSYGTDLATFNHNGFSVGSRRYINTGFQGVFPPTQQKTSLVVSLAMGPEAVLVSGSPLSGGTRRLATGETVTLTKASLQDSSGLTQVQFSLPSRFVRNESEYKIAAIDKAGLPLRIPGGSQSYPIFQGESATVRYAFQASKLPRDRIKEFRLTYRPSQPVVFRNVALHPNSQEAEVAPAPAVIDAVGGQAQIAKGVSLQLMGVSDLPSDTKHWWRPDGTPFVYQPEVFRTYFKPQPPQIFFPRQPVFVFRLTQPRTVWSTNRGVDVDPWWHSALGQNAGLATATFVCVDTPNGSIMSGYLRSVVEGQKSFAVRLWLAAGPWQQKQTLMVPAVGSTAQGQIRQGWIGSYTVQRLSSTTARVSLTAAAHAEAAEIRIVSLDKQSHQFLPGPDSGKFVGSFLQKRYLLSIPVQAKNLMVETRPYTLIDFKGIARQPKKAATPVLLTALQQKQNRDQTTSLSNLHQIGLAVFHYAAAHDEHFPNAAHWMDQIIPYLVPTQIKGAERQQRIAAIFHDPASPPGQKWSYAYNHALSGLTQREIDAPNQIVAVFESSQGVRNASDSGKSFPNPGWHQGGSDYVFTDAHVRWFGANDASRLGSMFIPVIPPARREIPIRGQVFDSRTRKPVVGTWVIFSKSPNAITAGSVWPSSFTDKAGRFQSMVYPVKNYLMVLENNRFKFAGKTVSYEANGNRGSISTQGMKAGPPRSARSDYMVRWTLPQGYVLAASRGPDKKTGANITAFTPIAHSEAH